MQEESCSNDSVRDMERYKSDIQNKRLSALSGLVAAILLYFMSRSFPHRGDRAYQSVVFGDTSSWPTWMFRFWPMEVLCIAVSFGFMMWLVLHATSRDQEQSSDGWFFVKLAAGVFVGFGCMFMAISTGLGGWYVGVEMFFMGGSAALIMCAFLMAMVVVAICIGYFGRALWRKLEPTWVGKKLHATADYLNAEDVQRK